MSLDDFIGGIVASLVLYSRTTDRSEAEEYEEQLFKELEHFIKIVRISNFCFRCRNYITCSCSNSEYSCQLEKCEFKEEE